MELHGAVLKAVANLGNVSVIQTHIRLFLQVLYFLLSFHQDITGV